MARSRCSCGSMILWKADEARSDEWLLIAKPDLPDELDRASLVPFATQAAFCSTCGHLWVDWGRGVGALQEYAPVDAIARPLRRSPT
jgi:hypothetical protein